MALTTLGLLAVVVAWEAVVADRARPTKRILHYLSQQAQDGRFRSSTPIRRRRVRAADRIRPA
jgi:hypothetical protein